MKKLVVSYVLIGLLWAWPTNAMMAYNDSRFFWEQAECGWVKKGEWWEKDRNDSISFSIAWGGFTAMLWPIGTPLAFLLTNAWDSGVYTYIPPTCD